MSPKTSTSGGPGRKRAKAGDLFTPSRLILLGIAVLAVVFIFENTRETKIRLLIPEVIMPLYLALLAMAVIGGLCGAYLFRKRQ